VIAHLVRIEIPLHCEVLYQVAVLVEDLLIWAFVILERMVESTELYVDDAPSAREEYVSPALRDTKTTRQVTIAQVRGNNVCDFRYLQWVLGRHNLLRSEVDQKR
jgi:hypothetical protein